MNLDRGLIKRQAKELVRNKVMKLFLTSFVISLCISIVPSVSAAVSTFNILSKDNYSDYYDDYYDDYDDYYNYHGNQSDGGYNYDYFNNFDGNTDDSGNDFYNFSAKIESPVKMGLASMFASQILSLISVAASILLVPLAVALTAFYVRFIRGQEQELGAGIGSVFREAFKTKFGKKIGVYYLKALLVYLLSLLFLIPGIIFNFSSYFAFQIMCDYPELSPWQAIMLSKKIVKGHRTELFVLELSFIPWMLLSVLIFPLIYVTPYYSTTIALYYENFRLRAIQTHMVTEDDFLSDAQKAAKYAAASQYQNGGQTFSGNNYSQTYQQNTNNQPSAYEPEKPNYFTPSVINTQQPAYYRPDIPNAKIRMSRWIFMRT
ncbi:MAG: DUF975 family protein [Clostridiales bacterium]|nr:DUF975 family protein [Clostridiales bacterium]